MEAYVENSRVGVSNWATYFITYFPRVAYDMGQMQRFAEEIIPGFQ